MFLCKHHGTKTNVTLIAFIKQGVERNQQYVTYAREHDLCSIVFKPTTYFFAIQTNVEIRRTSTKYDFLKFLNFIDANQTLTLVN